VKIAFGTGEAAQVRRLPYHAAHSVAFGLPPQEGLKAVTLNTAEIRCRPSPGSTACSSVGWRWIPEITSTIAFSGSS